MAVLGLPRFQFGHSHPQLRHQPQRLAQLLTLGQVGRVQLLAGALPIYDPSGLFHASTLSSARNPLLSSYEGAWLSYSDVHVGADLLSLFIRAPVLWRSVIFQ